MATVTIEVYHVNELDRNAFERAFDSWCKSDYYMDVVNSYVNDIDDALKSIMYAIGGNKPDEETAKAIIDGEWHNAFNTWAGYDLSDFIDAQTDLTNDMRDYLQTLNRLVGVSNESRDDAAEILESAIYDLKYAICDLVNLLIERINDKVNQMCEELWVNLQTEETFVDTANANNWLFTYDGELWPL